MNIEQTLSMHFETRSESFFILMNLLCSSIIFMTCTIIFNNEKFVSAFGRLAKAFSF